ncbi:MAG: PTS lactose/cellobiose transporter subunit IIA [Solobacterium sp.]|jgi:PTS system cellobiose-specific IIA component|nr:PTS lactose/cellobiose transporter subunit IIA [Solobacterium sp.]
MDDIETIAMNLISHAGMARSLAFQALDEAKKGNFSKADELMAESDKEQLEAHQVQTAALTREARGEKMDFCLLMVHAQDHLMTSMLAGDLIKEMIELYRREEK